LRRSRPAIGATLPPARSESAIEHRNVTAGGRNWPGVCVGTVGPPKISGGVRSPQFPASTRDPFRPVNLLHSGCSRPYSITLSARASMVCGMVRASALAVFMFNTKSNFIARSTGISPGFAPLSILFVSSAARRNISIKFAP